MVRVGNRWTAIFAVHDQRGATQTVAHTDRPATLLPRSRLDDRTRRRAANLPASAGHDRTLRRTRNRCDTQQRHLGPLPHAAQQVVDPLRIPGQPVHAVALPRRARYLDVSAGGGDIQIPGPPRKSDSMNRLSWYSEWIDHLLCGVR